MTFRECASHPNMYLMFKYATIQDQYKIFSAVLLIGASSVLCSCLSGRNVLLFHFTAMSMAHDSEGVILNAAAKTQFNKLFFFITCARKWAQTIQEPWRLLIIHCGDTCSEILLCSGGPRNKASRTSPCVLTLAVSYHHLNIQAYSVLWHCISIHCIVVLENYQLLVLFDFSASMHAYQLAGTSYTSLQVRSEYDVTFLKIPKTPLDTSSCSTCM